MALVLQGLGRTHHFISPAEQPPALARVRPSPATCTSLALLLTQHRAAPSTHCYDQLHPQSSHSILPRTLTQWLGVLFHL